MSDSSAKEPEEHIHKGKRLCKECRDRKEREQLRRAADEAARSLPRDPADPGCAG
jgi:hypothetical protein